MATFKMMRARQNMQEVTFNDGTSWQLKVYDNYCDIKSNDRIFTGESRGWSNTDYQACGSAWTCLGLAADHIEQHICCLNLSNARGWNPSDSECAFGMHDITYST